MLKYQDKIKQCFNLFPKRIHRQLIQQQQDQEFHVLPSIKGGLQFTIVPLRQVSVKLTVFSYLYLQK